MPSILVVGSVAYDDIQTPFERRRGVLGGSASYFSIAAARYAPVRLVAVVGDDFRQDDIARYERAGVDVRGLERRPGRSFHWSGRYGYDMSAAETLATELGVFGDWRARVPDEYADSEHVFLANIDPEIQLDVLRSVRRPRLVVLDTMNYWIEYKRDALAEVMGKVDVVCVNEAEARQFCRTFSLVRAAREIRELGPRALVVKRGDSGAILFADEDFWAPAYPLEKIRDPTGAGDAFAGGFLGYLARCGGADAHQVRRAVIHGTVCASFAVESFSVDALEAATGDALRERYRRIRELVAVERAALTDLAAFTPDEGPSPR